MFDGEIYRIAAEVGSRKKAFQLAKADHKLVRFYLPLEPDKYLIDGASKAKKLRAFWETEAAYLPNAERRSRAPRTFRRRPKPC